MPDPLSHPWTTVAALVVTALPLLLLTLGVLVLAVVSTCSRGPARREHSRQLIRELASFAKVLRSGEPEAVGTEPEPAPTVATTRPRDQPAPP
jgi:hypothetical protein